MKYHGSLEDLQTYIQGCGFSIQRVDDIEHGHRITTAEGALVNWYPKTGSISIQGKPEVKQRLEEAWAQYDGTGIVTAEVDKLASVIIAGVSNKKIL